MRDELWKAAVDYIVARHEEEWQMAKTTKTERVEAWLAEHDLFIEDDISTCYNFARMHEAAIRVPPGQEAFSFWRGLAERLEKWRFDAGVGPPLDDEQ